MFEAAKGKKLLIIGGETNITNIVRQAREMGVYTIVTERGNDVSKLPAKAIADEAWDIDYSDMDTLVKKCHEAGVDGVFSGYSEGKVYYDEENKPGISNLISLICVVNNMTIEEANEKYKDYNYKDFKTEVADSVCKFIKDIQDKFYHYRSDEQHLKEILTNGANRARVYASKKMDIVKEKVGLSV